MDITQLLGRLLVRKKRLINETQQKSRVIHSELHLVCTKLTDEHNLLRNLVCHIDNWVGNFCAFRSIQYFDLENKGSKPLSVKTFYGSVYLS